MRFCFHCFHTSIYLAEEQIAIAGEEFDMELEHDACQADASHF